MLCQNWITNSWSKHSKRNDLTPTDPTQLLKSDRDWIEMLSIQRPDEKLVKLFVLELNRVVKAFCGVITLL